MPWKLQKKGAQVCVVNSDTGAEVHCHGTRGQAMNQMRAMYASESKKPSQKAIESLKDFYRGEGLSMDDMVKEMEVFDADTIKEVKDSEKAVWSTADENSLPDSAFLFIENDGDKKIRHLPVKDKNGNLDAAHLRNAIARANQIKLKDGTKISAAKVAELQAKARKLLASIKKELEKGSYQTGETDANGYPIYDFIPTEIVTFDALDAYEESQDAADEASETVGQFKAMLDNIFAPWGVVQDKVAAINKLTADFAKRMTQGEPAPAKKELEPDFAVYKSTEGQWRWKGIYSNNQQDRDNPPDTLTNNAHKSFAYMVKEGIVPYPPLLAWHIDGLNPGQSDNVWYDAEKGNAWCEGYFHPDYIHIASNLAKETDLRMSHRMPTALINKDAAGRIDNYVSTEFSYLPPWAAANEGTEFSTNKEINMKEIPEGKKEVLRKQGWTDEQLQLAASMQKDIEPVVEKEEVKEPVQEVKTEPIPEPAPVPVPDAVKEVDALRKEVADALTAVMGPMQEQIKSLGDIIRAQGDILKNLQASDDDKVKEKLAGTPTASRLSLQDMLNNRVGALGTPLDGRTKEAKDGPLQTKEITDVFSAMQTPGSNWLDTIKSQ